MAADPYLLMLLVTLEQEQCIKSLFEHKGWHFCKTGSRPPVKEELSLLYDTFSQEHADHAEVKSVQPFLQVPIYCGYQPQLQTTISSSSVPSYGRQDMRFNSSEVFSSTGLSGIHRSDQPITSVFSAGSVMVSGGLDKSQTVHNHMPSMPEPPLETSPVLPSNSVDKPGVLNDLNSNSQTPGKSLSVTEQMHQLQDQSLASKLSPYTGYNHSAYFGESQTLTPSQNNEPFRQYWEPDTLQQNTSSSRLSEHVGGGESVVDPYKPGTEDVNKANNAISDTIQTPSECDGDMLTDKYIDAKSTDPSDSKLLQNRIPNLLLDLFLKEVKNAKVGKSYMEEMETKIKNIMNSACPPEVEEVGVETDSQTNKIDSVSEGDSVGINSDSESSCALNAKDWPFKMSGENSEKLLNEDKTVTCSDPCAKNDLKVETKTEDETYINCTKRSKSKNNVCKKRKENTIKEEKIGSGDDSRISGVVKKHRWSVNRNIRMHSFHRKCLVEPADLDAENFSVSENGFYCLDCKYIFKKKNKLKMHKEMKDGFCSPDCIYCDKDDCKDIYQCPRCPKCFRTQEMLDRHIDRHKPSTFCCQVCEAEFYSATELKGHLQMVHPNECQETFLCDLCGCKFSEKKVLNAHRKYVHTSERPEECTTCGRRFKTKSQLSNHLVVHKNVTDLNHSCEICGKMFLRAATLKDHVRRHKKDFSMYCAVCGKGFYRKYGLEEHMRIHTGAKPFDCKICGYKCALSCNLVKHMKIHQKQWPLEH